MNVPRGPHRGLPRPPGQGLPRASVIRACPAAKSQEPVASARAGASPSGPGVSPPAFLVHILGELGATLCLRTLLGRVSL